MTKSRSQIAIEALDEVAHQMERKWGVGRLPRLVPNDLAAKFWRQKDKLDREITEEATAGIADVEREAGRMVNAWVALDAAAEGAGARQASARYLTARMSDGRLLAICDRSEGMQEFVLQNAGQAAAVWMMDEVVSVLEGFDLVNRTKHLFDGAVVEDVRVKRERYDWAAGDPMPAELSVMGAG